MLGTHNNLPPWLRFTVFRLGIAVLIYAVTSLIYATLLGEDDWYAEAVVPTTAFLLSTLGPKALRKIWGVDGE